MFKIKDTKDVLKLALPAVGENILYMMIWVFDTMMLGRYGGDVVVSAAGLSSEIIYSIFNIIISVGLSVAITSIVARKCGEKNLDSASEFSTIGFVIGIFLGILIFLSLFIFNKQILTFAGAKDSVLKQGMIYMKITSIGIFFNTILNVLNAILRGSGNTKTPLFASALANVVNLGLDLVLIFGKFGFPELGVRGAAIATSCGQTFACIFIAIYFYKHSKVKINFKYLKLINLKKLKELIFLAIPSSLQEGAFSIARLASTFMIIPLGTVAFASNQIATTIESISFMPGWGFAIAATTLVGHKVGEKNFKKAREYADTCMTLGTITMLLGSLLFLLVPKFLIGLFMNDKGSEVIHYGSLCLMAASIEQPFMAISMILGGALKGSGDTRTPFVISLASSWIIRIPLMYYFIYILRVSVVYVWLITGVQWIFDGTIMFIMFKKKFKKA